MSVTPASVEEAVVSLQKIIDHPGTYTALQRESELDVNLFFESHDWDALQKPEFSSRQVFMQIQHINVPVKMFYVAPREKDDRHIVVFSGSNNEKIPPGFGIWDRNTSVLRRIASSQISVSLAGLLYVHETLASKAFGTYKAPDVYMYI